MHPNTTVDGVRLARRPSQDSTVKMLTRSSQDAAAYPSYPAFALAVNPAQGGQAITASVKTISPAEAEEAAIALAISST
ncbi:hypothetical protein HPB48_013395 [Haemaphysalis longicornis]|uniref:Uncharacterized protein n=1 Tax=Haemaphysalis longicornis TaxID=44386 RepID=A0A9J6G7S2_HAELO|nr:hypothetical protein HPB48_013395 [Haemaphysalis longicornis]